MTKQDGSRVPGWPGSPSHRTPADLAAKPPESSPRAPESWALKCLELHVTFQTWPLQKPILDLASKSGRRNNQLLDHVASKSGHNNPYIRWFNLKKHMLVCWYAHALMSLSRIDCRDTVSTRQMVTGYWHGGHVTVLNSSAPWKQTLYFVSGFVKQPDVMNLGILVYPMNWTCHWSRLILLR